MLKPRKFYVDQGGPLEVGRSTLLFLEDAWWTTSRVVAIMPQATGPVIETMNTIYWPHETDESDPYELKEAKYYDSVI